MLDLQARVLHHDSSKKLFGDVLELARQLILGLINDAEKEARHSIDQAKYETLTFIDALRNVAFAILLQTSNLTLSFVNEIQRKAEEYEASVIEMIDSLHTLPRITEFTVHEALFGGATIFHDPGSFVDILLTVLDALVLSSIWLMLLMVRRDFIHLFFGIISSLFSLHLLSRFTNLLIYASYGQLEFEHFVVYDICFVKDDDIISIVWLNGTPSNRPGHASESTTAKVFRLEDLSPIGRPVFVPLDPLNLRGSIAILIFLLCPCKHAKYSRFEKDIAVKDAKSNLIGVLIFYCFITLPFIVFDIGTNLGVAALTKFTEEAQQKFAMESVERSEKVARRTTKRGNSEEMAEKQTTTVY
ncbi:unnamed protein product, partial [Mesorhabditis belari]|uniref:Uncharacterized protein n=1 Tax=Mesorhabditis belari TaxID=2138241 RepID=A0AAF3FDY4_9BILA